MELPRDENALTDILHLLDHSPGIQIRLLIAQVHFSGLNIALQSYERGLKLLALDFMASAGDGQSARYQLTLVACFKSQLSTGS